MEDSKRTIVLHVNVLKLFEKGIILYHLEASEQAACPVITILAECKLLYFAPFRLQRILHLLENSVVVKGSKQKDLQVSLIILVYVRKRIFDGNPNPEMRLPFRQAVS